MRLGRIFTLSSTIGLLTGFLLSIRQIFPSKKWRQYSTSGYLIESATSAPLSTSEEDRNEAESSAENEADEKGEWKPIDFAELERELSDLPLFQPGDHVLVINPLAAEGTLTLDEPPIQTVVERVAYVQDIGMYAYELAGQDGWHNENWLQPDEYMPMIMRVEEVDRQADIGGLLDEMNDYKRLAAEFGDEGGEYKAEIERIKEELKETIE